MSRENGGPPGRWLRQRREDAGLSQEELAERSGLSVRTVSSLERGSTRAPHPRTIRLLGETLGLPGKACDELITAYRATPRSRPAPVLDERASPTAGTFQTVVPRELPGLARHFVGREAELEALTGFISQAAGQAPGTVVISAIGGTAGVGKTALALQWAHQMAGRFPDGQLYVNLRGYDPGRPMTAGEALPGFLRALGVPEPDIPAGTEERAARYRSLLSGRRVLIILDNACASEQVRPLLPAAPACVVLVTSRDTLAGLVARDGARRLDLDLLPMADAIGLLRALIGGRVDADPEAGAALAAQCSRLPLALRVAAEIAAMHPARTLADLVGELEGQQRLDLLDAAGDEGTAVRAVFSWSYRHLDASAARAFRLAGLHPGPDLDRYAVAALAGTTLERAGRLLDVLARGYLMQPARPGRYAMHDLLRGYARELAVTHDGEEERQRALTRLFDYYLHTAALATGALFPAAPNPPPAALLPAAPGPPPAALLPARPGPPPAALLPARPGPPPAALLPAAPGPPPAALLPAGPAAAVAWLDAERAGLLAAAGFMTENGWPGHASRLADTLLWYLDAGGHYPDAVTLHHHGRCAAHDVADRAAEGRALIGLGIAGLRQGRYLDGASHFRRALELFGQVGDEGGAGQALCGLGVIDRLQGRYEQAASRLQQALDLCRAADDTAGAVRPLGNLGLVALRQGHPEQAAGHLEQAVHLARQTGNLQRTADMLTELGGVALRRGRHRRAASLHRQALATFRQTGNRTGETQALNGLGEVFLATSRPGDARALFAAALGLASRIGLRNQQARAHRGLGQACAALGDLGEARQHWQEALVIFTSLGTPQADHVRARLAAHL
jgi:tetratricopeptide (TPR) repeat protein/transcriptional regulator with XRE-family HTH domain